MFLATTAFTRRCTRILVLWLLATVLPLQGAAVGVFAAMGPAHIHLRADVAPRVLEDFRRWRPAPVPQAHVFTSLGHFHAIGAPQRHYHGFDDASVVRTGDDGPLSSPDADEATSASLASVLALLPTPMAWAPPTAPDARATRPRWQPQTGFIALLERPPKAA